MNDLYGITALDVMELPVLTSGMRHEKDIWCHVYKGGIRQCVETMFSPLSGFLNVTTINLFYPIVGLIRAQ